MSLKELTSHEHASLILFARKAGRLRFQAGHVKKVGRAPNQRWRGLFYVYEQTTSGEKRRHKSTPLGLVKDLTKTQAKEKLRVIIADRTRPTVAGLAVDKDCTLQEFWEAVALPSWEPLWKEVSRKELKGNIRRYVLAGLGHYRLGQFNKAMIQIYINGLASRFSHSVVEKAYVWSRALFKEAVDNEFLTKNPAEKVKMPETRKILRPTAAVDQLREKIEKLPEREQLVLRIGVILGLRPGEILALRVNDVDGMSLRIDEGNRYGKLVDPKTDASAARVWMTPEIKQKVEEWIAAMPDRSPAKVLFPAPNGKVARLDNYRSRFWKPSMDAAGLNGLTMQMCRRTCGTYLGSKEHGAGTVKDIQAHLRHAQASTTMDIYVQEIPASVRKAVEGLDNAIFGKPEAGSKKR